MYGHVITTKGNLPTDISLIQDIYRVLYEYYGISDYRKLPACHKMEYKLYELLGLNLICCADHDCERRQEGAKLLDLFMEGMQNGEHYVFATRPVTEMEVGIFKELLEAVDQGWSEPDAEWLVVNEFLALKNKVPRNF